METTRMTPPAPHKVGLRDFRARMAHFVNLVCYKGVTIFIERKGKAVARIDPIAEDVDDKILMKNAGKMPGDLRGGS